MLVLNSVFEREFVAEPRKQRYFFYSSREEDANIIFILHFPHTAGERMCEDSYGIKDYKGPLTSGNGNYASDEMYGARSVQGANITMPNGSCDPWHSLSVINETGYFYDDSQKTTDSETIVFIDGTAHCREMYSPGAFAPLGFPDSGPVVWAHQKVNASVREYLGL